jgi:hypothetical protein
VSDYNSEVVRPTLTVYTLSHCVALCCPVVHAPYSNTCRANLSRLHETPRLEASLWSRYLVKVRAVPMRGGGKGVVEGRIIRGANAHRISSTYLPGMRDVG